MRKSERLRVESLLRERGEELLEAHGYELVDVSYAGRGRRGELTFLIDKPEGVTADDCQDMSRQLSVLLDALDPLPGSYHLIVSSPGIERPLTKPEHYERFAGRLADVTITDTEGKRRTLRGRLGGLREQYVILERDGEAQEIALEAIAQARLAFDWEQEAAAARERGGQQDAGHSEEAGREAGSADQ
ncbi:MAG: ribosome maturation factor RimP [Armatimonadota bacterium]